MSPLPLSAFIIAKNEADRLPRTLEALRDLCEEIILVDSGSTDGTREVAAAHGARVIVNEPFPGYGEQKRFAEDACRNDWVLNVDADEVASPALRSELLALFVGDGPQADGYETPIVELLPFDKAPSAFAHRLHPVRLYRRSRGRYNPSPVHDRVDMTAGARIGRLKGELLHTPIRSLGEQRDKLARYAAMQADDYIRKGRRVSALRLLLEFPLAFLKAYVIRRYGARGLYGYLVAVNYGYFRLMRLVKVYEAQMAKKDG